MRNKKSRSIFASFWLIQVILLSLISGCSSSDKVTIAVSGSTTVLPVVSKAADLYRLRHPGVMVVVNAGGSGVGMNQLGEKRVDIGMISRDITDEEVKRFPDANFVMHLIGKDAVAAAISSEVYDAGINVLSIPQIRSIYEGMIKNWKELGGPDRDILVIDKEQGRGTRHVFMKTIFGDKSANAPGADLVLGSNNEEQTALIQSDSAIGMLSLAWLNNDVKGAGVRVGSEVVYPSKANIVTGRYPISRGLMLVTDGEPTGAVKDFIDFIKGKKGQEIVEESGYVSIK